MYETYDIILYRMSRIFTAKWSFIIMVILPTLITLFYNLFIATPFYHSEAKLMVKSLSGQDSLSGFAGVLRTIGIIEPTTLGPYVVLDYLTSRDFMFALDKQFSIKERYSSSNIDVLQRFDPFKIDPSYENFYRNFYVGNVINVKINPNNSIITVSFRYPDPEYSKSLAEWTLNEVEIFVNKVNERAYETKLKYFVNQVQESREKVKNLADRIKNFLKSTNIVAPEQQAGAILQTVVKLQEQLLLKQLEFARIQSVAPDNPRLEEIKREIDSLQRAIQTNMNKLAREKDAIGPSAVEMELLKMEMQILQKELEVNIASLIQAANQLRLQQFYVERVENPRVADAPVEPRIFRNTLTIFAIAFAIWGIIAVLYSGVREHAGK